MNRNAWKKLPKDMGSNSEPDRYPIELTLEEAFTGTKRTVRVSRDKDETRVLEVAIPPGVDTGSQIRLREEGTKDEYGQRRNVHLMVTVRRHPYLDRKGDDLYVDVPVPRSVCLDGGAVEFKSLDGRLEMKVPAGTREWQLFRLKDLGMPKVKVPSIRGDLYARVVLTP